MQHLEVSGAVRHIYIYVIRRLKVNASSYGLFIFSMHFVWIIVDRLIFINCKRLESYWCRR